MKIITKTFLAIFALAIITLLSKTNSKSFSEEKYFISPLIKSAKSFLSFANLPYCNKRVIRALSCPLCSNILDSSYKVKKIIKSTYEKRNFQVVILQSDSHGEIVVSFAGPKLSLDQEFYSAVFNLGYERLNNKLNNNVQVEQIFAKAYQGEMQSALKKNLGKILSDKKNKNYKIIFVGHSVGGSLASLAAYDLYEANLISANNQPQVYSYGQLKVGNEDFIRDLNSKVRVIRIIKNSDMTPVLQNCHYNQSVGKWDCSKEIKSIDDINKLSENNNNKVSPADEVRRYNPGTFRMAYGGQTVNNYRRSFMQLNENMKFKKNKKQVNLYYGGLNNDAYYRSTDNNKLFWQPIGNDVIFSRSFRKFQICSYTQGGAGKCEPTTHRFFDANENSDYFKKRVDIC